MRKRPSKAALLHHLKTKSQQEIADHYGVSRSAVSKWKRFYRIKKPSIVHRPWDRPNPIVECQCGCGATFRKYLLKHRIEQDGTRRQVRISRRYLRNHGSNMKKRRLAIARRVAGRIGDTTNRWPASMRSSLKFETDFSDEYLGEAWLALAEGDDPKERLKQVKREDNRSIRMATDPANLGTVIFKEHDDG